MDDHHITNRLHAFDLRISRSEQEQTQMSKVLTDLAHEVWGNGRDGMDTRLDRLEQRRLNMRESIALWIAALGGIAGPFVAWWMSKP